MNKSARRAENRDFKMWYDKAVLWRQIVKINSSDVSDIMTCVSISLAFYYSKVLTLAYSILCKYYSIFSSNFNAVFTV